MTTTSVTLYRSVRKEEYPDGTVVEGKAVTGVLYPDFEPKLITGGKKKGQYRPADVRTFESNGEKFVRSGGGTSLFDKANVFGTKYWVNFIIPKGTEIPDSLTIRGPDYNEAFDANHYQIEVKAQNMRIDAFRGALNNLARNAIVRSLELATI